MPMIDLEDLRAFACFVLPHHSPAAGQGEKTLPFFKGQSTGRRSIASRGG
jgi:hypothetical protein